MRRALLLPLVLALSLGGAFAQTFTSQTHEPRVEMAWNRYRSYEDLSAALRRLVEAYPRFVALSSIGKSSQGRDLWLVTVTNPDTGADTAKAAIWIDGNIHGNEVQGGDACLYTIWYLMEYYGRIESVTRLVDQRTFYILPVVNPDGRAAWFGSPNNAHSARSGQKPTDEDRDGAFDEDGYDDLDGDGEITEMRKLSPEGDMIEHPDDPRVLVRAPRGKPGKYLLLGSEGVDNDGDGKVNEDPPGGYDLNRNWPGDWQPEYAQYGAGDYPLSHPESRAIAEFLIGHANVAGFQSYHNAGGMILRGPGAKEREEAYPAADIAVYDAIGKSGEEMLPFYRYMVIWKDLYSVHGGEVTWAYEDLGILAMTNELWSSSQIANRAGEDEAPRADGVDPRYQWMARERAEREEVDRLLLGEPYAPWKEVDHPTYGKIEVGGFRRMYGRVAPAWMIEEMLHRNAAFTLFHASEMPRPEIESVETLSLGGGLFRVDLAVANPHLIPTITARAAQKKIGRRDLAEFLGDGIEVVAGGTIEGRLHERFVPVEKVPSRLWFPNGLGSHARLRVRWIVSGTGTVRVAYDAERGGRVEREVRLGE
ncbi:MAG: peptidase M14 [Planctomycetes bacterium]|nr:peptidase M14 [Planctomycetota bacterium]